MPLVLLGFGLYALVRIAAVRTVKSRQTRLVR
jgi:hypothetical protein